VKANSSVKALREFSSADPSSTDAEDLRRELHGESDRASAVLWPATIETALEGAIIRKLSSNPSSKIKRILRKIERGNATFHQLITIAYDHGILGQKTQKDLNLIREIRNAFAHTRRPLKFDLQVVRDVCELLYAPDQRYREPPASLLIEAKFNEEAIDESCPRTRYIIACGTITHYLFLTTTNRPNTDLP
jgi:hypothetical protein